MLQRVATSKPREERRRTMLPARIRSSGGWSDACILNISSRGLLVYSNTAVEAGSTVEVRRGGQLVIARVVWRQNQRIGLCSPDPVPIDDIISDKTAAAAVISCASPVRVAERRRRPRSHERSREWARAAEFVVLVLFGTAMAGTAAIYVGQALANPMARITSALEPR